MRIRCPDKPIRTSQESLSGFEKEGGYLATYKYDGWRCIIDWDGENVGFYSRRDVDSGGPTAHPVSDSLREEVLAFIRENKLPPNTRLDSEWIARRTEGPEAIYVFGIQYLNGEWLGRDSEDLRWTIVEGLTYNQPHVHLADAAKDNYVEFFNKIREKNEGLPEGKQRVEGIVLKRLDGRLLGNIKTCKKNPSWFKVKWRDGASGYTPTF
jgi:ATP-dependent DNA ligase